MNPQAGDTRGLLGRSDRWARLLYRMAGFLILAGILALAGCDEKHRCWGVDTTPPAAPRGLSSVTGDGEVTLHWIGNTEEDLDGYRIYRSTEPRGYFPLIATVRPSHTEYVDRRLADGVTYYYAIAAFDEEGNESELSWDSVYDTPRPEGSDLRLDNGRLQPEESGYDWSAVRVLDLHDPDADIYYWQTEDNGPWMVATERSEDAYTDIQDAGFAPLDQVDFAPTEGWASAGEVPLVLGHSYVVWTWDNHFAKFRVVDLNPERVLVDWAYQTDRGNRELAVRPNGGRTHVPVGGLRVHQAGVKGR